MAVRQLRFFYSKLVSYFELWFGSKYGYYSAVCFSYTLLVVISICLLDRQNIICYVDDEFGYWGIAASLAGYDWRELLAITNYYSFGYSILLVPLYFLSRLGVGMLILYKLGVIINGILLVLSFKMTTYAAGKMFPHLSRYYLLLISLVTTLYVSNVAQVQTTWTETCLYFMFWCVLVCLIKVLEKPRLKYIFLLLLSTAYIFTVHMRALGVVISVGLILAVFILLNYRQLSRKQVILTLIVGGILFVAVTFAKELVSHYIYADNPFLSTNDFSGQAGNIVYSTTSITGLYSYLLSLLGKLYYLGVSSWGFAFLALAIILFKVFELVGKWFKNRKITLSATEIIFIFVGMASMAQVCVTAMFKSFRYDSPPSVADTICYGRYSDFIMGPLLLIGFAALPEIYKYMKEILISILGLFICALTVQSLFDILLVYFPASELSFRPLALTGMMYLFPEGVETGALFPALVSGVIFLIVAYINLHEKVYQKTVKWLKVSVISLIMIGVVWGGLGLQFAYKIIEATNERQKTVLYAAELLSDVAGNTDIYVVSKQKTDLGEIPKRIQWLYPELSIRFITPEEFDVTEFNKETVYILGGNELSSLVDNHSKRLAFYSNTLCIFTEEGSEAEKVINRRLEATYSEYWLAKGQVDLVMMSTNLSYQKYNGSLYYNFNHAGYMTWNTGLQLPDGTYEFTIDMEVSGLTDGGEIGYITATDAKEMGQKTYPLNPQNFSTGSRQQIKVQAKVEDYAEPLIGIYNYGNCSMKINNVDYQQIRGNTAIAEEKAENLREMGKVITQLNDYRKMAVCYVDSDSSAIRGFPDFKAVESAFPDGITETIPGVIVPDKKNIGNRYYLMENTDDNTVLFSLLDKGSIAIYKNKLFTLLVPDDSAMREIATDHGLKIQADGKAPLDLRFLYETKKAEIPLSEMSDISLPRGRYEVSVNFKIEEIDSIDAALIFLNGEEIKITREMLDENYYREVYELELTESSPDVRLGLFASRPCRITEEYIGVKRIGDCYGYIQKIPVYDLECENAVCYADSILTKGLAESSIVLRNFPLEFGEYMLTFTGQQTTGTDAAQIKIYRNGVLRTDEPVMFEGEGEQEFAFGLNECEPAEWDFEIICPAGSRLELSDFAIVR